jgi:DNA-binding transcriptional LysR family regulator
MLDRLTLDQLRALVAVAESGSFSAAARRFGRVQSAVSQSIQSLEAELGTRLFDRSTKRPRLTEAGRALLEDARALVEGAELLRARAASLGSDMEAALALAVDEIFPGALLMASLKALSRSFPYLPVTLFTEGLGAPEQRLRDHVAQLAIYSPLTTGLEGLESEFLTMIPLVPVVAARHPLAMVEGPLTRDALEPYTQLVLTDRSQLTAGMSGGILSRRIWRFADLGSRLDYLLAGFGWCNMPQHLVEKPIAAGRLKRLQLKAYSAQSYAIPLHVVHERVRPPGRAGRWLIADLKTRLAAGESATRATAPKRRRKSAA